MLTPSRKSRSWTRSWACQKLSVKKADFRRGSHFSKWVLFSFLKLHIKVASWGSNSLQTRRSVQSLGSFRLDLNRPCLFINRSIMGKYKLTKICQRRCQQPWSSQNLADGFDRTRIIFLSKPAVLGPPLGSAPCIFAARILPHPYRQY